MSLDDKDKHTMCMRGMRTDLRFCVDATCTELTQSLMQAGGDMGHQNEYKIADYFVMSNDLRHQTTEKTTKIVHYACIRTQGGEELESR
jgi:hypothetical protein